MGLYVIGDIHGCYNELMNVMDKIHKHSDYSDSAQIVFVGDYIDRGPASKEVVDFLINYKKNNPNVTTLMGNHEYMFLYDRETCFYNGGRQTWKSYGIEDTIEDTRKLVEYWNIYKIDKLIGRDHFEFYKNLDLYSVIDNVAIAHAGIDDQYNPVSAHSSDTLLWSRRLRKTPHTIYKYTVHGHTPMDKPYIGDYTAYIDTGCVFDGRLTALYIPNTINPNKDNMEIIQSDKSNSS